MVQHLALGIIKILTSQFMLAEEHLCYLHGSAYIQYSSKVTRQRCQYLEPESGGPSKDLLVRKDISCNVIGQCFTTYCSKESHEMLALVLIPGSHPRPTELKFSWIWGGAKVVNFMLLSQDAHCSSTCLLFST